MFFFFLDYKELDSGFRIHFDCPDMDLREIGLVTTTIHRLINKIAIQYFPADASYSQPFINDFVSLKVASISSGSLSLETKLKIYSAARDYSINVAAALTAAMIISIAQATTNHAEVSTTKKLISSNTTVVDVGPNIRAMITSLSKTGKPWSLTIEDSKDGEKVVIRSTDHHSRSQ